jgi:hypothetical protein
MISDFVRVWEATFMRVRPQRYNCPHCNWDFAYRKKRRCLGCGTLLLVASDMLFDRPLFPQKLLDVGTTQRKVEIRTRLGGPRA